MWNLDRDAAHADAGDSTVNLPRFTVLMLVVASVGVPHVWADGGAIVDRGEWEGNRFVLWVNPSPPTVGPTEWTLMYAGDTASASQRIVLRLDGEAGAWQEELFAPVDAGRAVHTCDTVLPFAGEWIVTLRIDGSSRQPRTMSLRVQPAAEPWHAALPWMLLWIPAGVLLILRESLAMRQGRARNGPLSSSHEHGGESLTDEVVARTRRGR
ncbi:MAG: hypothetical protein FJ285_00170 [Planctomycetes bacterium]|nr:hypothetical protein [Planctomycetota bacterium]